MAAAASYVFLFSIFMSVWIFTTICVMRPKERKYGEMAITEEKKNEGKGNMSHFYDERHIESELCVLGRMTKILRKH